MARFSAINNNLNECMVCGTNQNIHIHHVFRGAYRTQSEAYHYIVPLCIHHHTVGKDAVHNNKEFDLQLKRLAQIHYESYCGTRNNFIEIFGKNYLD